MRRFLAPYLRDHPVAVYAVVAVLFLLWLTLLPDDQQPRSGARSPDSRGLAVGGVEILRRQTAREFPDASTASDETPRA